MIKSDLRAYQKSQPSKNEFLIIAVISTNLNLHIWKDIVVPLKDQGTFQYNKRTEPAKDKLSSLAETYRDLLILNLSSRNCRQYKHTSNFLNDYNFTQTFLLYINVNEYLHLENTFLKIYHGTTQSSGQVWACSIEMLRSTHT